MSRLEVPVRRVAHGAGLPLPTYATEGSAGLDLMAAITAPVDLPPMGRAVVPTGIAIALPSGYEAQVRSRSGLAAKHGITVLNAPGTIDTDYRGEIGVTLVNLGDAPFRVEPGMRVAQMVVAPVSTVAWNELEELPASRRGGGGFGSTGNGNAPG
ncbi:MAG TPA: dUTP diphosphatase [Rhodospirillales bacterium]|nr:dUTP diphosphatase [Rhodospirillales bacterium]